MNELKTERLHLRPLAPADEAELLGFFHDDEVKRYLCDGANVPLEAVQLWVADSITDFEQRRLGLWGMREDPAGPLVGITGFRCFFDPPVFELLFAFLPAWHGRGFAFEAATAAMVEARCQGMSTLYATTDAPNTASLALLKRLGFSESGREPGPVFESVHFHCPAPNPGDETGSSSSS